MNAALIGVGKWGKNYLTAAPKAGLNITHVCALRNPQIPGKIWEKDWIRIVANQEIDLVIIAVNPSLHFAICEAAIKNSKHVIVEKPLTLSVVEAVIIEKLAKQFKKTFIVNYIQLWDRRIRDAVISFDNGWAGLTIESRGMGNGPFRDYSSLWDWGSHDIALCHGTVVHLTGKYEDPMTKIISLNDYSSIRNLYAIQLHFPDSGIKAWIQTGNYSIERERSFKLRSEFKERVVTDNSTEDKLTTMLSLTIRDIARNKPINNAELAVRVTSTLSKLQEQLSK